MEHDGHALLEIQAAAILVVAGMMVLALALRRALRGERSGVVLDLGSRRAASWSILRVPAVGLMLVTAIVVGAAILNHGAAA